MGRSNTGLKSFFGDGRDLHERLLQQEEQIRSLAN